MALYQLSHDKISLDSDFQCNVLSMLIIKFNVLIQNVEQMNQNIISEIYIITDNYQLEKLIYHTVVDILS